jgi:cytidylate kinase
MIKILTIEREYGSGAGEIAQKIGERLGWRLWDQALTCEIARLADCDQSEVEQREERKDPLYYRLFKSFLRGSYEGSLNVTRLKLLDCDSILHFTERVVQKVAAAGHCVIVGRGSQYFLRDRTDTLRIFLYAPVEEKVRRLMSLGKSETEALELVATVDSERAAFIKEYFGQEWPNRTLYHAMLNTAAGDETVIQTILNLIGAISK